MVAEEVAEEQERLARKAMSVQPSDTGAAGPVRPAGPATD